MGLRLHGSIDLSLFCASAVVPKSTVFILPISILIDLCNTVEPLPEYSHPGLLPTRRVRASESHYNSSLEVINGIVTSRRLLYRIYHIDAVLAIVDIHFVSSVQLTPLAVQLTSRIG